VAAGLDIKTGEKTMLTRVLLALISLVALTLVMAWVARKLLVPSAQENSRPRRCEYCGLVCDQVSDHRVGCPKKSLDPNASARWDLCYRQAITGSAPPFRDDPSCKLGYLAGLAWRQQLDAENEALSRL
jgi:hypothetical protein